MFYCAKGLNADSRPKFYADFKYISLTGGIGRQQCGSGDFMRSGEAAGGSYSTHIPAHILVNRFAYTPFTITKFLGVISNTCVRNLYKYHDNQTSLLIFFYMRIRIILKKSKK